jgi:hypothetical protein
VAGLVLSRMGQGLVLVIPAVIPAVVPAVVPAVTVNDCGPGCAG